MTDAPRQRAAWARWTRPHSVLCTDLRGETIETGSVALIDRELLTTRDFEPVDGPEIELTRDGVIWATDGPTADPGPTPKRTKRR